MALRPQEESVLSGPTHLRDIRLLNSLNSLSCADYPGYDLCLEPVFEAVSQLWPVYTQNAGVQLWFIKMIPTFWCHQVLSCLF